MTVFDIIIRYREAFTQGFWVTMELAFVTWTVGLGLGALIGVLGHRLQYTFGVALRVIAFFLSGIPLLVLLYWVNYPLQELLRIVVDPFYTAVTLLCLLNTIGVAEICRSSLDDFPSEYLLAARACGLNPRETVWHIQLPLILRKILPSLLNQQVIMLQMTLFASLISVEELFRMAQEINSEIHKPVEIYTALAVFFLLICLPINGVALWLRGRFTRDISER